MANEVLLQEGHPLDSNLRPLKIGGESSSIELSQHKNGSGARVNGELNVIGDIKGQTDLKLVGGINCATIVCKTVQSSHITSTDLTIDDAGDITLDAAGGDIDFNNNGSQMALISGNPSSTELTLNERGGTTDDDYFAISCASNGSTLISTTDAAGDSADLSFDADGDITLDSHTGVFIAKKAGTEFSAANSAYAGMILGYTRISNDSTTSGHANIEPDATMTVLQTAQGTDVSVSFVAPPSGNVEISMLCSMYTSSRTLEFALSDNASFNEIAETHTYDAGAQSSDETDINMTYVSFVNTGLTPGTSYERWIGAAESVSGGTVIRHGRNRTSGLHYPPIIVKAIALPATIVTGE